MREETAGHSSAYSYSDGLTSSEHGGSQGALKSPPIAVLDSAAGYDPSSLRPLIPLLSLQPRTPTLREKTNHPVSSPPPLSPPPPPPHPPARTVLSSRSDTQSESSNDALKDIGPDPSGDGKENADIGDGHIGDGYQRSRDWTVSGGTAVRISLKRAARIAVLNEELQGTPKSDKVRHPGQSPGPSRCRPRPMT